MKIRTLDRNKKIVLVTDEDVLNIAKMFMRVQEHYESPMPGIRGQIFTIGMLREAYVNTRLPGYSGVWDYHRNGHFPGAWKGFNVPSSAIKPFLDGLFDPLTPEEQSLVDVLRGKEGPYYVIGVEDSSTSLDHEIAHAMFFTDTEYYAKVRATFDVVDSAKLQPILDAIEGLGYCKAVLIDEAHAYCGVDADYFIEEKLSPEDPETIATVREISKELVRLFEEAKERNEIGDIFYD